MKQGRIIWIDNKGDYHTDSNLSYGEGQGELVCCKTGKTYYFHSSACKSLEVFKGLARGKRVLFDLYTNLYMSQVDTIKREV